MKIAIIGAGAFGTALGNILLANQHEVSFFDPIKYPKVTLETALKDTSATIYVAPSELAGTILPNLPTDRPLINASKGFLSLSLFTNFDNFSIISGGAFAKDLEKHQEVTLTSTDTLIDKLFTTSWLNFDHTSDQLGVLLCGSLKNIYAIGAGFKKLHPDTPEFTEYINQAITEIKQILALNRCQPQTADLSCGIHDLVITCSSKTSRNYSLGAKLRNEPQSTSEIHALTTGTTEGLSALTHLADSTIKLPTPSPILDQIIALGEKYAIK